MESALEFRLLNMVEQEVQQRITFWQCHTFNMRGEVAIYEQAFAFRLRVGAHDRVFDRWCGFLQPRQLLRSPALLHEIRRHARNDVVYGDQAVNEVFHGV